MVPGGDGGVAGVGMWSRPGLPPVRADEQADFDDRLDALAGPAAERLQVLGEIFVAAHPADPAWFLQFLGFSPASQGLGLGSKLLRTVLDAADAAGEAAYLEAKTERNRALYERHGFVVRELLALPDGPTAYAMWRDPWGPA